MVERWLGVVVASDKITAVDAEVPPAGAIVIQGDHSIKLQNGDRANAYAVIYQQLTDYIVGNKISKTIIKASALSQGSTRLSHLEAAELRGVAIAAAATASTVDLITKARISKTFGNRNVDEYVKDDEFWKNETAGSGLRSGSREAAMIILGVRKVG